MNPINQELREIRITIEHYKQILVEDIWISIGEMEDDGRQKLSNHDKKRIKEKIEELEKKRQELLRTIKDIPIN